MDMRTALFWVIMPRVMLIPYRCFGTTYRSHLYRSRIQSVNLSNRFIYGKVSALIGSQ